jgi:hypothetical protein
MHNKARQTALLTLLSAAELRLRRHPRTLNRGGSSISLWTTRAAGYQLQLDAAVLRDAIDHARSWGRRFIEGDPPKVGRDTMISSDAA